MEGTSWSVARSPGRSGSRAATVLALVVCVVAALVGVGCVVAVFVGQGDRGPHGRLPAATGVQMTGMHDMSGH